MMRRVAGLVALLALLLWLHLLPGSLRGTETQGEQLVRTLAFLAVFVAGGIATSRRR